MKGNTPSVPKYKVIERSNSRNYSVEMTSIPLILHYPPTFRLATHQPQLNFVLSFPILFFGTNFELLKTLYFGTDGVQFFILHS
jgi:hypothetical protein